MVFDSIEQLKQEYTDKYVVVDGERPELARFDGRVGIVKTINMNGRALVEFQDYIANIGWFDIGLDFLKVVPKPEVGAVAKVEKPVAKKAEPTKPVDAKAGEKKLSPIEMARAQGAAKAAGAAAAPTGKAPQPAAVPSKQPAAKPTAPASGKMSTADILAAARAKKAAEAAAAPAAPVAEPEPSSVAKEAAVIAAEPVAPSKAKPKANSAAVVGAQAITAKPTTTAEKIAVCRQVDANRNGG